jgi:spermidine/putrescine transport system substrate-binding protein
MTDRDTLLFDSHKPNRRQFGKLLGAFGVGLTTATLVPRRSYADDQATFLTWGGYDVPELHPAYIEKHGQSPAFSLFGDEDEAFQKVRAGYVPDLAHPTTANVHRWRDADLVQSVDTARLSNWGDVFDTLKKQDGVVLDSQVWSIPFDWGRTSIVYRTDLVDIEEESWGLLWDERYSGRLSAIGAVDDLVPVTAMYAGINPYSMSADEVERVMDLVKQQKPLLRFYSDDMTTLQQALASGELVAAMAWDEAVVNLKSEGVPVKFMNPKEGVLTWLGGIVVLKNAPQVDKAYDLLDALLDPEAGRYLINDYGYGHANAKSYELVSAERLAELEMPPDPASYLASSFFLKSLEYKDMLAGRIADIQAAP